MLFILISSLFEMLGGSAVLPLIQPLIMPQELMQSQYVQFVMEEILSVHTFFWVTMEIRVAIIIGYFIKNIVMSLTSYIKIYYANGLNRGMMGMEIALFR